MEALQFTYSFWFKVEPGSVFDTVLFLRAEEVGLITTKKMHPIPVSCIP
jgi:hypothetical protein